MGLPFPIQTGQGIRHPHAPRQTFSSRIECLACPTQKPLALLERIIAASSRMGDVVLDPFAGCGTTAHAAQKMGRQWLAIDQSALAVDLLQNRLPQPSHLIIT